MKTLEDYLDQVLPEERKDHYYYVLNLFEGSSRHSKAFSTKAEVVDIIRSWQDSKVQLTRESEMYVSMASFNFKDVDESKWGRKKKFAGYNKAFFLDIDCEGAQRAIGEEETGKKNYSSKDKAIEAIDDFLDATEMPQPTIISSGWGIHVYWVLEEGIPSDKWAVCAKQLKKLVSKHDLNTDSSVTADVSRILRPLGTMNYKVPSIPKEVEVKRHGKPVSFKTIKNILDNSKLGTIDGIEGLVDFEKSGLKGLKDEHTDFIAGKGVKFSWEKLKAKSINGDGCGHIKFHLTAKAKDINKIEEPMWRAMVTIAALTEEKDQAVIEVSRPDVYEDYDEEVALTKMAEHISSGVGAHRCSTINDLAQEYKKSIPDLANICKNCEFTKGKKKINSPLKLAVFIPENKDKDMMVDGTEVVTEEKREFKIPEYPAGYVRHSDMPGVWIDTDEEQKCIYPNYVYPTARYEDAKLGIVMEISHHTPQKDVLHFMLPNKVLVSNEECKKFLASYGVMTDPSDMLKVQKYLISFSKLIADKERAKILHDQFGWKDNYTKFVVGPVVYDGEVASPNPPSSTMNDLIDNFHKKGSLEDWKKTFGLYNRPGSEAQALALLFAFGATLMPFTNTKGIICHLTSSESGTGKTTVQRFINSVWGDPNVTLIHGDTKLSKVHVIGVMNNLPVTLDEITDIKKEEASQFAYLITQGRTRLRMSSDSNKLREHTLTWNTVLITSGNSSIFDIISSKSKSADGELNRIFELRIKSGSSESAKDSRYDNINNHYGHAGPIFAQHIVKNKDEISKRVTTMIDKVAKSFGIVGRERFLADGYAAAFVGGEVAKELGLINYDLEAIWEYAKNVAVPEFRTRIDSVKIDKMSFISEFLADHNDQIIIGDMGDGTLVSDVHYIPRKIVSVRIADNIDRLYIRCNSFKSWCVEHRVPLSDVLDESVQLKALIEKVDRKGKVVRYSNVRLGKGTTGNSSSGPVSCYEFILSKITGVDSVIKQVEAKAKNDI